MNFAGPLSLHRAAQEAPRRPAVVEIQREGGLRLLTFEELSTRVLKLQVELREWGVCAGMRVAVQAEPSLSSILRVSALMEEGGVPVLVHPRWPEALARERTVALGAARWKKDGTFERPANPRSRDPHPARDRGSDPRVPGAPDSRPASDECALFFTSGSSERPKAVRLSQRALLASAQGVAGRLGLSSLDRWLLNLPVAHIGGFSIVVRMRLQRGPVVVEAQPGHFDPDRFVQVIAAGQATLLSVVPTMLRRLVRDRQPAPPCVRGVLVGGAAAPLGLLEEARALGWPTLSTYGMTEACSTVTLQSPGDPPAEDSGRPLEPVELRVRDAHIEIRGPILAEGYAEGDWPTSEGWFRTGDLGRLLPDGSLKVDGRADAMIISGGENVAPARVEALLESVPGVREAVVLGRPDEEWGEMVVAVVSGMRAEGFFSRFRACMERHLAAHERPKRLFWLAEMPQLPNGKIDRRSIRAGVEGGAFDEVSDELL